jgi:hypothetical protein
MIHMVKLRLTYRHAAPERRCGRAWCWGLKWEEEGRKDARDGHSMNKGSEEMNGKLREMGRECSSKDGEASGITLL